MPYDKEIHIGFVGIQSVLNITKKLNISLVNSDSNVLKNERDLISSMDPGWIDCDSFFDSTWEYKLNNSFIDTCTELGYTKIDPKNLVHNNLTTIINHKHMYFQTPWGIRETPGWQIGTQFDRHECGDVPEDLTFGINLSSRYFPSILDMKDQYGTLGNVVAIDLELNRQIEVCRKNIVKYIPEFEPATIFLREIFY